MWHVIVPRIMIYYSKKIYTTKSAKEKGTWSEVRGKPGISFQGSWPSGVTPQVPHSPEMGCNNVYEIVQPGKLRDSVPRVFTGGCQVGSLCLVHTEIPDTQKGSRCSAKTILFRQRVLSG